MKKGTVISMIICGLWGLMPCSCVYPYDIEVSEVGEQMVIEGDIIIGGITEVRVSYVAPLTGVQNSKPRGLAWVEDASGHKYYPAGMPITDSFTIDTSSLPVNGEYSLHYYDAPTEKEYVSEASKVWMAPHINNLYYTKDNSTVSLFADISSLQEDGRNFRLDWYENYEYTADFLKSYEYDPKSDSVVDMQREDDSLYYCWDEGPGNDFRLVSMAGKTGNIMPGNLIKTMNRGSRKLSSTYRITLYASGLSPEGYKYLDNMKKISSVQGSLFSPNPSEVHGNITCKQNPDEFVRGFVNVCTVSSKALYVSGVYRRPNIYSELFVPQIGDVEGFTQPLTYYDYFQMGFIPVTFDDDFNILWGPLRCIDCREYGGTKTRPDDWPTSNY